MKNPIERAQHGCYAAIPGTGPSFMTCQSCDWLWNFGKGPNYGKHYCRKYVELTKTKAPKPIDTSMDACRYYRLRGE